MSDVTGGDADPAPGGATPSVPAAPEVAPQATASAPQAPPARSGPSPAPETTGPVQAVPLGAALHRPPVADGLAMKRRGPVVVWLLPLVTFGIYHLVWYYKIHKEMAAFDRRRAVPVAGPMLVLLLLGWTLIAPIVSYYNTGKRIQNAQTAAGMAPTCSPTLSWVLLFVFGFNTSYMQSELNRVVDQYAGAPEGTRVPLYA
jgi:hypothetical protein